MDLQFDIATLVNQVSLLNLFSSETDSNVLGGLLDHGVWITWTYSSQ